MESTTTKSVEDTPISKLEDTNCYTNDDMSSFNNCQWEMKALLDYLIDCNVRKITYFKIALGILSVFITGFGFVINAAVRVSPIIHSIPFQALISLSLIIMGLLTYTVIRELYSIFVRRIFALRQMNCLRQSMDSIRFKKCVCRFPDGIEELYARDTEYWKYFGQYRVLPLGNEAPEKVDMSISRSPDLFMMIVLFGVSFLLQGMGVGYLVIGTAFNSLGGFGVGVVLTITTSLIIGDFLKSRSKLISSLAVRP